MGVIDDLLLSVEEDINALGWDKPHRLFAIEGAPDDPYLVLIAELPVHPVKDLEGVTPLGPRAKGVVVVTEAWEANPTKEIVESLFKQMEDHGIPEQMREMVLNQHFNEMAKRIPLRYWPGSKEVRMAVCVLRGGTDVHLIQRERNSNDPPKILAHGGGDDGKFDGALIKIMKGLVP